MLRLDQQTPPEIAKAVAHRARARRKSLKITQEQLAKKSGVSLGSIKRFEQTGKASIEAVIKMSMAMGCEDDFSHLFEHRGYASIEEVIADAR